MKITEEQLVQKLTIQYLGQFTDILKIKLVFSARGFFEMSPFLLA